MNSKMEASLMSAKNENTVGLFNLNVDFSCVKVEIPKQYQDLGNALSTQRRENAENGQHHKTARRLGVIFKEFIPDIEVLSEAYGKRVSEIAKSSKLGTSLSSDFGPFARHVGVDGTSILAAVSSGREHVALHMLACMLARMFSSSEATAIWVQIVEARLSELETKADPSQLEGMAALFARAQGLEIRRDDLASWDASARAWLESANHVKKREETQLKLIIKNIPSITGFDTTYTNVMKNWKTAMEAAQNSIKGIPQDVSNGAALLGFWSWHIFPDIQVFSPDKVVEFHDELVKPGGVITLGLETTERGDNGVQWSLSLSHLRYYGDPVLVEKSIHDGDRLTVQELRMVSLGSFIHSWTRPEFVDILEAAECFAALGDVLKLDMAKSVETSGQFRTPELILEWITPLVQAARDILSMDGKDRENAIYRVEYGRRRGRNFLDPAYRNIPPMFGLTNRYLQFKVSKKLYHAQAEMEAAIAEFRLLAQECNFHENDAIIVSRPMAVPKVYGPEESRGFRGNMEIASAVSQSPQSKKRLTDGELKATKRHNRWLHVDRTEDPAVQRFLERIEEYNPSMFERQAESLKFNQNVGAYIEPFELADRNVISTEHKVEIDISENLADVLRCNCAGNACDAYCQCRQLGIKCTSLCSCLADFDGSAAGLRCSNVRICKPEADGLDEDYNWLSARSTTAIRSKDLAGHSGRFDWLDPPASFIERYAQLNAVSTSNTLYNNAKASLIEATNLFNMGMDLSEFTNISANAVNQKVQFRLVAGGSHIALFLSDRAPVNIPNGTLGQLTSFLKSDRVDIASLRSHLTSVPQSGVQDYSKLLRPMAFESRIMFSSLEAMFRVSQLYHSWPEATISIGVTRRALGLSHWANSRIGGTRNGGDDRLHRSAKFSCLALMESGEHDIHLDQVEHVMALATGNSIYAAEYLLQDPCRFDKSATAGMHGIRRILGNLGYPGIVMLVPPPKPLSLKLDPSMGRHVNADKLTGELTDRFRKTSMHLRCTDFTVRVAGAQGAVDGDVIIREALVQVFDGPRWVTDLDLLASLSHQSLRRLYKDCNCSVNPKSTVNGIALQEAMGTVLRSVTQWDEVLLCQENLLGDEVGVVCTAGNWYARLAVAGLAALKNWPTIICPERPLCDKCIASFIAGQQEAGLQQRARLYIL